jgi:hypothetical protein
MKIKMLLVASLGLLFSFGSLAEEKAPFAGTWKLDLAKSKYDPGPAPRSATDVNTDVNGAMKSVQESVDAEGKASKVEWTAKFDGKDYPVTGGAAGTTISLTRPDSADPRTVDWVWKVPGKPVVSGRTVYSKDGKSRTITDKSTDAAGKTTARTRVYQRQ